MVVDGVLFGHTLVLVLGLPLMLTSLRLVEMDLGVNSGTLLGDSLLHSLGDCCCLFRCSNANTQTEPKDVSKYTDGFAPDP